MLLANTQLPTAVLEDTLPLPRHTVIPFTLISQVAVNVPDAPERRNDSMLLRLNTTSWLSVVPMN